MMPVMDGFEVLTKLRETPSTETIPVVILTAVSAAEIEQKAFEMGVNHFISKPFHPDTLETTIKVALREARTAAGQDDDLDGDESSKVWGGSIAYQALASVLKESDYIKLVDSLKVLENKLGGGLRLGTVTLVVGSSGTGKSVLCQTVASGALLHGHGVA